MTPAGFTPLDWTVVAAYAGVLALAGWLSTRRQKDAADYFLAGHRVPIWLVAVSVLSTTQSAATFLGAPDYSYRGDYTYLTGSLGALLAAFLVARVLIPRFYALKVTTAYELLRHRFDARAMRAAGGMYLVGRIFASGARLYLAAIAVAMIAFSGIAPGQVLAASLILVLFGLVFTYFGGLRAVLWSDLVQVLLYVGAALLVLFLLWSRLPMTTAEMVHALASPPSGPSKLRLLDFSLDPAAPFSLVAVLTGVTLLNFGNSGLDQDNTQRLLACRDSREGGRALYAATLIGLPVILVFLMIGSLLHLFYDRPELIRHAAGAAPAAFQGEKITIFMRFILGELPPGVRGLAAVGVLAAAALNSELISMSSVVVEDFYRPWLERRRRDVPERHFVQAGRLATILLALALLAMSFLCYFWQRYTAAPLLAFALGVMSFAYSGLLGVYFTALFTTRGNSSSVIAALAAGFLAITAQQPYVVDVLHLPAAWKALAFPYQLCIGTAVAFLVCVAGRPRPTPPSR
ncbi:MAG: sodium:solute symporter [Allosphingosinicella sp.]